MSVAKNLGKALGGVWRYDGCTTWRCDDGKRYVVRTHCGAYDTNGEALMGPSYPPHYWLYGHGARPEHAERYMKGEKP